MRQGHLPTVIQLMRYGADPAVADGEGYRALHLAILFQHMAIAAYLMAKEQVRLQAHRVAPLLVYTVLEGLLSLSARTSLCSFFDNPLICPQEVDGPDCNGQTPLMLAAQKIIG